MTEKELKAELETALNRIYDMLLGDDGQAFKEAERFLLKHRPEAATTNFTPYGEKDDPGYYSPANLDKLVSKS